LGCGSLCTQGFALGWYRSAPLALEAIRRVWIFGKRHNYELELLTMKLELLTMK
jgi:hypothetical protein